MKKKDKKELIGHTVALTFGIIGWITFMVFFIYVLNLFFNATEPINNKMLYAMIIFTIFMFDLIFKTFPKLMDEKIQTIKEIK